MHEKSRMGVVGGGESPVFAAISPYGGVARRQIGRLDLIAQNIGVLTPGLSALGTGLLLPHFVGPGFWLSAIGGFGLAILVSIVLEEFSSRFNAAGSLYTYAAKGLGRRVALVIAVALMVTYAFKVAFGLSGATERAAAAWSAAGGTDFEGFWFCAVLLCGAAVCLVFLLSAVRVMTRFVLVIEVVTIGFVVAVLVVWVVRYGMPDPSIFALEGASPDRIIQGAALVATLTVAFESSAMLGLESRMPLRAVPSSMKFSLWMSAALFFLATVVGVVGPEGAGLFSYRWFSIGSEISYLDAALLTVMSLSLLALAIACWAGLARLLFALAREGALARRLGRVDHHGVPRRATLAILPFALAIIGSIWASHGFTTGASWWDAVRAAAPLMFIAYGIAAVALIAFLGRIGELRPRVILTSVAAAAGAAVVVIDRLVGSSGFRWYEFILLSGVLIVGVWWHHGLRASGRLDRIGSHDAALVSDVYIPTRGRDDEYGRE